MRAFRLLPLLFALTAATGAAKAVTITIDPPPARSSIKVERITPDMMFEICGFERQDQPFFLDSEYRRAIADLNQKIWSGDIHSPVTRRLAEIRDALEECREDDMNKRYAKRAMRSCRALVKNHDLASIRAEALLENGYTPKGVVLDWGERFRPPLEKCLKSMRCRLDNKQDLEETLAVYRQLADQMQGWLLDVKGLDQMKICGSTMRDIRNWCESHSQPDQDGMVKVNDICTNGRALMLTIRLLQNIKIRKFPQTPVGEGAQP
ncbi:MAG: hypothetical protein QM698_12880 [Micropepsaceae bacterium]